MDLKGFSLLDTLTFPAQIEGLLVTHFCDYETNETEELIYVASEGLHLINSTLARTQIRDTLVRPLAHCLDFAAFYDSKAIYFYRHSEVMHEVEYAMSENLKDSFLLTEEHLVLVFEK